MISKTYIKSLDFENIDNIFNYIVESKINGNFSQYKELINKLSNTQFKHFIMYLEREHIYNNSIESAIITRL